LLKDKLKNFQITSPVFLGKNTLVHSIGVRAAFHCFMVSQRAELSIKLPILHFNSSLIIHTFSNDEKVCQPEADQLLAGKKSR